MSIGKNMKIDELGLGDRMKVISQCMRHGEVGYVVKVKVPSAQVQLRFYFPTPGISMYAYSNLEFVEHRDLPMDERNLTKAMMRDPYIEHTMQNLVFMLGEIGFQPTHPAVLKELVFQADQLKSEDFTGEPSDLGKTDYTGSM
jgi:hypothetical protein